MTLRECRSFAPIFLALAATLTCGCRAVTGGGALARVRKSGVLRWGADEQGGEPFVFEDPKQGGKLSGFEVDLAEELGRTLGVRAVFVQNDWSNLVPSLERGTFDIALNGLEITAARAGRVRFSRPYFLFSERLVARVSDGSVRDLASLRGRRVGTLANSQAWEMLQASGALPIPYEGVEEPFIDLENGRTDGVLLDDIIVDRYAPGHAGLRVVGDVAQGRYAIAVRRDAPDLQAALDRALDQLIASGRLRAILRTYGLDSARQDGLSTATVNASTAGTGVGAPRSIDVHQLLLFLQGALVTLLISCAAMALAITLGVALATLRMLVPRVAWLVRAYIEIFRGTPVLLQLYVLYYGLADVLSLDAWTAAIVGLGLNYAAYEAEIYRAGVASVPRGQIEAAQSLGMNGRTAFRCVVMPQALRVALPGMTNDFIAMLKDSALVSVITVVELTKRMTITAVDLRGWLLPGLLCAALYFMMSYPLSRVARRLERHLTR
ncbi:MAG TPA: ABC transporter substrate-binding protein/permease [Polyangia bacterium]|nr:ABC transporter substrate-binding protein/permease [Polyangia bacterium]